MVDSLWRHGELEGGGGCNCGLLRGVKMPGEIKFGKCTVLGLGMHQQYRVSFEVRFFIVWGVEDYSSRISPS